MTEPTSEILIRVPAEAFQAPLGWGISARWTDQPSRPPFERHPARVRDAVALDSDRFAATPDGLLPRSCEPGADEHRASTRRPLPRVAPRSWRPWAASNAESIRPVLQYCQAVGIVAEDRKSTRLNSSHGSISYAVFCLKKKKN